MFFCWDILVEAGTTEKEPDEYEIPLPKGIITTVAVKFPAGCHGMVKIRLFHESLQLVPLSDDEWVTGDDETVPTSTYYELIDDPRKLKMHICSPETEFPHTVTVRIEVQLEDVVGITSLTRMFKQAMQTLGLIARD